MIVAELTPPVKFQADLFSAALAQFACELYAELYGADADTALIGVETMLDQDIDTASADDLKAIVKRLALLEAQARLVAARHRLTTRAVQAALSDPTFNGLDT